MNKGTKKRRRTARRFTESFVRKAPEGLYCDALTPTLNLLVKPSGARSWVQRLTIGGTQRNIGLGGWPVVTLAEARDAALDNRRAVRKGINPRTIIRGRPSPTFGAALDDVLDLQGSRWKDGTTAKRWRMALAKYASHLHAQPVADIAVDDVLKIIKPLWGERQETAGKVRLHISAVMEWSIAKGYRKDNPAKTVLAILPKNGKPRDHRKSVPYAQVPAVCARIRDASEALSTKLAFEFLIQTATRTGEVRGATWDEIDLENGVWAIPGERTKARRDHSVPLTARALQILDAARLLRDRSDLIFPSTRRGPLGDNAFQRVLKTLGIDATPHGFRSSFRDWCAETGQDRSISEAALAHVVGGVEGAYYRTKHFAQRRDLMTKWSEYIK